MTTLALLLPGLGSDWSAWAMLAVFVAALALATLAVIWRLWGAATETVPRVHTPEAAS